MFDMCSTCAGHVFGMLLTHVLNMCWHVFGTCAEHVFGMLLTYVLNMCWHVFDMCWHVFDMCLTCARQHTWLYTCGTGVLSPMNL